LKHSAKRLGIQHRWLFKVERLPIFHGESIILFVPGNGSGTKNRIHFSSKAS